MLKGMKVHMRRILSILTALFLLIGTIPLQVFADSHDTMAGSGTEADPYIILTLDHLDAVRNNLSAHYKLGADIDASETASWNSGAGFAPVGDNTTKFTGSFDGHGHTISGLTINRSTDYIGLFGYTEGSDIRNIGMTGVSITGRHNVGGLVGENYNSSTVTNAYVTGSVMGSGNAVGGLVGNNTISSTIANSYATASVTGLSWVGGLVGTNFSTITDSYATGSVTGNSGVGGLAGLNSTTNATITDSYATGAVTSNFDYAGGLVGYASESNINRAYTTSKVSASGSRVGGLVGYAINSSTINQAYATGFVSGTSFVGGLVGSADNGTVTNSFWDIGTTGQSSSAGGTGLVTQDVLKQASYTGFDFTNDWFMVAGSTRPFLRSEYSTTITNTHQLQLMSMDLTANYTLANNIDFGTTFSDATRSDMWATSGNLHAGFSPIGDFGNRFVGKFDGLSHTITGLFIDRSSQDFAGLIGYADGTTIQNIGMTGGKVAGRNNVGGLVGLSLSSNITNAYTTGAVSGSSWVGGLVGLVSDSSISNGYSAGAVTGGLFTGGLAGYATNGSNINQTYAMGKVSSSGNFVGGLVGDADSNTIFNSYYNTETTTKAGKGTGLTTAQMMNSTNFVGVDFSSVWDNQSNQSAPYLRAIKPSSLLLADGVTYTTIFTLDELQGINNDLGGKYALFNDIDASSTSGWNSGAGFSPIGNSSTHFTGHFNGLGHSISDLYIYRPDTDSVGLFGHVTGVISATSISNISMLGGSVTGRSYVGGLVGINGGGNVIKNASTSASVTGASLVGGLVGYNFATITDSYATGEVIGSSSNVGGLVGLHSGNDAAITDSYATGAVSGAVDFVGGLVGNTSGTITNAYATGTVTATGDAVGGLAGAASSSAITDSYATGSVTGRSGVGGLVGYNYGSTIEKSYATGSVTGNDIVGGLVGHSDSSSTINQTYATGSVTGSADVGGLVGRNNHSTISNSFYDQENTGQGGDGTGLTMAQMKDKSTFTGAGWDFDTVWAIHTTVNSGYPFHTPPYTVTYASIGSTGGAALGDNNVYMQGGFVTVSDHGTLEKTGYTFAGWSTAAVGGGTVYKAGETFEMGTANVTLYAQWIDDIAPELTVQLTNADGSPYTNNTWTNQTVTASVYASDAGSGLASLEYSEDEGDTWQPYTNSLTYNTEGIHYLTFKATDQAGNEVQETRTMKINQNGLHIAITAKKQDGTLYTSGDWTNQSVTVEVYASHHQEIPVASLTYSLDNEGDWSDYSNPLAFVVEGVYSLRVTAQDEAGNTLSDLLTIRIDKTAPSVTLGTNDSENWAQAAQATVTVTDSGSGVDASTLQYAWTTDTDTPATGWILFSSGDMLAKSDVDGDWYLHIRALDKAGNAANAVSHRFQLDSSIAELSGLEVSEGTLSPAFAAGTTSYKVSVGNSVSSPTIAPVTADPTDTVTVSVNGRAAQRVGSGEQSKPLALDVGDNTVAIQVTALNGLQQTYTVTITRAASGTNGSGSGGGNSPPSVIKPVIDLNGTTLDPDNIDTTKPSITIELMPKDGAAYVSIPASILTSIEGNNADFIFEIKTPYGSYQVPVNLASLIPGLMELLSTANLEAENISFKVTLTDKSGNKDIQAAMANGFPNGKVMGAIVDFSITIVNTKTGETIEKADQFSKALTRVIPMPKDMTIVPEQWGAFRFNEAIKRFEFIPAKKTLIDGVWYVVISSYTNSVYVVVQNSVSFTDVQKHWSQAFVQLAAAKGLVFGVGEGKYAPDKALTRAEFTTMLVRALGRGTVTGRSAPYNDVKSGSWYFDAVAQAKELELLDFVNGESFMPDQPLKREEMASMLAAVVALEKLPISRGIVSLDGFKDIGSVDASYLEDIRLMVKLNIMTGTGANIFSPKGESSRAQAAVVILRTMQTLGWIKNSNH
jgi:uncharacterized repeat protein (TIGR02543 family)